MQSHSTRHPGALPKPFGAGRQIGMPLARCELLFTNSPRIINDATGFRGAIRVWTPWHAWLYANDRKG